MTTPTGPIKTPSPEGGSFGISWEALTQYDDAIHAEADPVGQPIERVRGHIAIESRGNPKARQQNNTNGWSYGLLQVVPFGYGWEGWHELVRQKAGLPKTASQPNIINALYDPKVNIAVGVAILESFYQQHQTLDKASSAFFLGNPNWQGADTVNGNTGQAYKKSLDALIAEQKAFAPADVITTIVGGAATNTDYGFKAPTDLPYYEYFVNHGGTAHQHTGIDATGWIGEPLFSPIDGTVVCAGINIGPGAHGSGCAAFAFTLGAPTGSSGRFEIITDDGQRSLILGHVQRSLQPVGARVTAGQQVALMGGYDGPHVHVEARIWQGGDYTIVDPRQAFGGGPLPVVYAERIPTPQPADFTNSWRVVATRDGVPVMQSTASGAPKVGPDLKSGEDFRAVGILIGEDNKPWWISSRSARVPLDGTEGPLKLKEGG